MENTRTSFFFMQTKARVKQNRIPDLRLPNGNLTTDSKIKKEVASNSYAETFSKRIPDPIALQKSCRFLDARK